MEYTTVCMVDIGSHSYHIARSFVSRLVQETLGDPAMPGRSPAVAGLPVESFHEQFADGVGLTSNPYTKGRAS